MAAADLSAPGSSRHPDVDEGLSPISLATSSSEPIALGGATYARAFDNCVAFGPLFPDELLTEHEPNERVVLSNLFLAMKIYAHAVYQLTR